MCKEGNSIIRTIRVLYKINRKSNERTHFSTEIQHGWVGIQPSVPVQGIKDWLWPQPADGCTGKGPTRGLQPPLGNLWGSTQSYTALSWCCVTRTSCLWIRWVWASCCLALHGRSSRKHPTKLTAPGHGGSHGQSRLCGSPLSGSCRVCSMGKFPAAIFQVLKQASLQAEHRDELKPGIKCLAAGRRGCKPVLKASLGWISLLGHCHCHCCYCH